MKLIAEKQGRADKLDVLRCVRGNGTQTSTPMPRQGILPHDLIHYVVESTLGYRFGFLGMVAGGADIAFAMQQSHEAQAQGLADEAVHAEAIVESLQAQLWSGGFDEAAFHEGVRAACAARSTGAPDLHAVDIEQQLLGGVIALNARWQQVPFHASLELDMPHI